MPVRPSLNKVRIVLTSLYSHDGVEHVCQVDESPAPQSSVPATRASRAPVRHIDVITAISVIEQPFRCIVAGDRSGSVRVWE